MYQEPVNRDIVEFLQNIGVDTRFVSIVGSHVYVNNQRFSRFSGKRQETFIRKFPSYNISRSKVFQKICTRASRVLANSLKPGEKIFIRTNDRCARFILDVIMEPYTRKYGIKIVYGNLLEDAKESGVDSIALPVTLDDEVESILENILNGEKIDVLSSKSTENNYKFIYPLLNVPGSWLVLWLEKLGFGYEYIAHESIAVELLGFFEDFIPDVRENILKSALYVTSECVYDDNK